MPKFEVLVRYTEVREYRKVYAAEDTTHASALADGELGAKFARGCGYAIVRGSVEEFEEIVHVRRVK